VQFVLRYTKGGGSASKVKSKQRIMRVKTTKVFWHRKRS